MFTAEFAAGLPALLLLFAVGGAAVSAATTRLRCVDAARDAALAVARGGTAPRAPIPGAVIRVTVDGDQAVATVAAPAVGIGRFRVPVTVSAVAIAALEPGAPVVPSER
ncbi:TadE family type IV pilus minor pilin [Pilimelia columellifera]|uniref:TadE-like protein n=1 Tax=Pilimelia columellifera subsp. columellifera TaxID=706583 RepID=A0ABP6AB34_9ACTN